MAYKYLNFYTGQANPHSKLGHGQVVITIRQTNTVLMPIEPQGTCFNVILFEN